MIAHSKPWINEEDITSVNACLRSNMIANGETNKEFEKKLAAYTGVRFAKTFSSGTSALVAALMSLNIKSGDEVLLPTYVCHEVMDAVLATGAKAVLCDVGSDWIMDPGSVAVNITKKSKAIIVVHTLGIRANVKEFLHLELPVIEDCSQCLDTVTGRDGLMAIYSFNSTKCLAAGEGGAVTTSDQHFFDNLRRHHEMMGARMSDLQASLALSQLQRYDEMLSARKDIAEYYFKTIDATFTNNFSRIKDRSMFYRFLLTSEKDFESVRIDMEKKGVVVRKGVDALLHEKYSPSQNISFPGASQAIRSTISIPIYPSLTKAEQAKVAETINTILR